jgi:hypothetical protein
MEYGIYLPHADEQATPALIGPNTERAAAPICRSDRLAGLFVVGSICA